MGDPSPSNHNLSRLRTPRRKAVRISQEQVVKISSLQPNQRIPILIEPGLEEIDLASWAACNREYIEELLLEYRALLFRGFGIATTSTFKQIVLATSSGELLEYNDRSTPRYEMGEGIYASTIYPPDQTINLHNEGTYWLTWPLKIYFCCLKAASRGGETPIADVRRVLARIDPLIRQRFLEKKLMYVRNYNEGIGLSWPEVFQTTDRCLMEEYCRRNAIEFEWEADGRLRTRQVRSAIRKHPRTGELVWFNHGAFFHIAAHETSVRDGLLGMFSEENLPYMTYEGDGTPIPSSVIEEICEAYRQEKIVFPWQAGDVLLLDNMSIAHGREAYAGERQVMVAMADPYRDGEL